MYVNRLTAAMRSSLEDAGVERGHLVTLTLPHDNDLSPAYLEDRIDTVRKVRRLALSLLRLQASERRGVEPADHRHCETYQGAGRWGDVEDWTEYGYIWAVEITPGSERNRGWHVHVHCVVNSLPVAECLRHAWLTAARRCGEDARLADISSPSVDNDVRPADGTGATEAARYATAAVRYVQKAGRVESEELERVRELGPKPLRTYVEQTRGLRRYDAGGTLRPLGMTAVERFCTTCGSVKYCGDRACSEPGCDGRMRRVNPVVEVESARGRAYHLPPVESAYGLGRTALQQAADTVAAAQTVDAWWAAASSLHWSGGRLGDLDAIERAAGSVEARASAHLNPKEQTAQTDQPHHVDDGHGLLTSRPPPD